MDVVTLVLPQTTFGPDAVLSRLESPYHNISISTLEKRLGGRNDMKITIKNWDTFQPRKDRGEHKWFRLENTIAYSETLDALTPDQRWFWVCLLAHASKKGTGTIEFNVPYFEKHFGVSEKQMRKAIEHFTAAGSITVDAGNRETPTGYRSETNGTATDRQTDNTDKQTYDARAGFERTWDEIKTIPGITKGAKAFDRFAAQVAGDEDEAILLASIKNYKAVLAIQTWRTPKTSFETFLGTERSGFFWRQFETMPDIPQENAPPLNANTADHVLTRAKAFWAKYGQYSEPTQEQQLEVFGDEETLLTYRNAGGRKLNGMHPIEQRRAIEAAMAQREAS